MTRVCIMVLVATVLAGCGRDKGSGDAGVPADDSAEYRTYFAGWLEAHGEQKILISSRKSVTWPAFPGVSMSATGTYVHSPR